MLEKAIHRTAQKKTEAAPEQTSRVKMALLIFAYFIKIGSFTFGSGWSILAQMEQEFVDKRRWLTKQELLELVAVGKSLPGIMITNITMVFGYQMAGVLGGILAVLGIALPAVVVLSLVTLAYRCHQIELLGLGRAAGRTVRGGAHHRRGGHLAGQRGPEG